MVAAVAALLTACGAPSPVSGTDKAKPAKKTSQPPSSLVATPDAVSQAVLEAWGRHDQALVRRLTTATAANALAQRPFPDPHPMFVNCKSGSQPSGGQECLFQSGRQQVIFTVMQQKRDTWLVTDTRFEG
jgi:hypothetical protein